MLKTAPSHTHTQLANNETVFRDAVRRYEDDIDPFLRGVIATRVYRDESTLSAVEKRAEIVAKTLEAIKPVVFQSAEIAGAAVRRMRVHHGISDSEGWRRFALFPEAARWEQLDHAPEDVQSEYEFWRNADERHPQIVNRVRARYGELQEYGLANPGGACNGHTLPDHSIILTYGIDELKRQVNEARVKAVDDGSIAQFGAMERCLNGLSHHIESQADALERAAEHVVVQSDASRLRRVASVCRSVIGGKPQTFHEALQLLYFSNFTDRIGNVGDASSYGRVDQLLYRFYIDDIESGRLSRDEAYDLVCHFMIKIWGDQESRNLTVGGVHPDDGSDATNDLSRMFVEAMDLTGMTCDLSARIHSSTPDDFLEDLSSVMKRHFGRPDVYNDDVAIPSLVAAGIDIEDARDYAPLGCVEIMIPGRSTGRTMGMGLNHLKILELVLNSGACLVTGDVVWPEVPDSFESQDQLIAAFRRKVEEVVAAGCDIIREDERLESTVFPRPWLTVLSRGGVVDGRDYTGGQPKYDPVGVTMDGVADVANSLYAVDRLVFREHRISMDEYRNILKSNWQDRQELRDEVINGFPRFGQDRPEVDAIVTEVASHYAACFDNERTLYDGPFLPMIFGVTTSLLNGHGPRTGATPSGRLASTVIAQSLQPASTGPQGSPTEVLRSAAAVDFQRFPGGVSNVQNFDPSLFTGESGDRLITDMIRGYFDLGGIELAMNFVSAETMREAQRHPDEYPYLMVRLFGMSARFVLLSAELQETVIEKVEAATRAAG